MHLLIRAMSVVVEHPWFPMVSDLLVRWFAPAPAQLARGRVAAPVQQRQIASRKRTFEERRASFYVGDASTKVTQCVDHQNVINVLTDSHRDS
jgi:hypothetical protein